MTAKPTALNRPVSRDQVVRVAFDIIDADGIEGFNLRLVARKLGIKAPSLYNHFSSKADLLECVSRELMLRTQLPDADERDWREYTVKLALYFRRNLMTHYNVAPLLLSYFPRDILISAYDRSIRRYEAPVAWHLMISEGVEKFTLGSALFAAALKSQGKAAFPVFDRQAYAQLATAIEANPYDDEQLFTETVRHFLSAIPDGLAAAPD